MRGERVLGHPTSCEELRAVHESVAGYVGISCRLCRLDPLDGDFDVLQERFGLHSLAIKDSMSPTHAVMDFVVNSYFPVVQMIEDEVLSMEQRLLDAFLSREDVTRLFQLRREAIHVIRAVFEAGQSAGAAATGRQHAPACGLAAILGAPTAIAAIYGMNFSNMPELHATCGYPIVLGVILSICLGLYTRFKKLRWL